MAATNYPITAADPARYTARERAVLRRAMRLLERDLQAPGALLASPGAVRDYLRAWIGGSDIERFCVLYLDGQQRLIVAEEASHGTLMQTSIYPREIVRAALRHNAAGVVLAHNHPSGACDASRADIVLTRAIQDALRLVDVRALDHLIVTRRAVFSFAERGLI